MIPYIFNLISIFYSRKEIYLGNFTYIYVKDKGFSKSKCKPQLRTKGKITLNHMCSLVIWKYALL